MSGPGIILITTMPANTPQLKAFAADITLWTLGSLMNSPPLADADLSTISSLRKQKTIALGAYDNNSKYTASTAHDRYGEKTVRLFLSSQVVVSSKPVSKPR